MNKHDDQLSTLYQLQATEQPSKEVDQKILALAKEAPRAGKKIRLRSYNFLPYSVAASMAIAGLLFLSFPEYYQISPPPIKPDSEPYVEPLPSSEKLSSQPAAFAEPQAEAASQHAPVQRLTSPAPAQLKSQPMPQQLPQSEALELMKNQTISLDKNVNTGEIIAAKQRMSAKIASATTELTLAQRQTIEKLLKDNHQQQAIKLLRQLRQQNPQLILPLNYQQLLDTYRASEQP